MSTDAFTPYAQELCDIALRLCEAAAGKKKANADAIEAQIKAGLVHLARLNREHASLCVRANEAANGVVQQKLKHEEDAFLLQNKKVERMYYERMIASNRNYKSKHTATALGLAAAADFEESATEEAQAAIAAADDADHERYKQRLLAEGRERERLQKSLQEAKQEQQAQREGLAKKQALLDTIAGHLDHVVAATKGPFRLLQMPSLLAPAVHSASAAKLPAPLFTIFSQLSAVSTAFSLDVRVSLESVSSSTKDTRKRKSGSAADDQQVVLAMHRDAGPRWFVIFAYYAAMDAVLARCSGSAPPPLILEALRPHDLGDAWPTPPAEPPAVHLRSARPFKWCQRLAGQDLRGDGGAGGVDLAQYRHEKRALAFLSLLQLRHGHIKALHECLARLRDGAALEALCPAADAAPLAGAACACRDWQELAAPRISEPPTASSVAREEGEVHDAADVASAAGSSTPAYLHAGTLVVTTQGDSCAAQFRVTSSLMYPFVAPVFHVSSVSGKARGAQVSLSPACVAEIEARVNVTVSEQHAQEPMPAQVGVLCAALAHAAFGASQLNG